MASAVLVDRGDCFNPDQFTTDVETGVTRNRAGRRVVGMNTDFLVGFREALTEECGPAATEVLRSCGRSFGELWARGLAKEMDEFYGVEVGQYPMALFNACLRRAFSTYGWGDVAVSWTHHGAGVIVATVTRAPFASLIDSADRPVDDLLGGVIAGVLSYFSGQKLDVQQTDCPALGDAVSRFVVARQDRIDELREADDLPRGADAVVDALLTIRSTAA